MSIQDEINRINQNVANTYSALSDMGATLPETQNSDNMASAVRTIPQSGGNSAPAENEIAYIYGTFEMGNMSYSTSITYAEIEAMLANNKYVVAKSTVTMGGTPTNTVWFPLTAFDTITGIAVFEGNMQANLSALNPALGLVLLAITVEIWKNGEIVAQLRVVSTTDLN